MTAASLIIAVPLYRAPELIPDLFAALAAMAEEIAELGGHVILINDSPDDAPLAEALARALPGLEATLWTNAANLGFIRTANRAMDHARDLGADLILLNSDARPVPGAFREMVAVADSDPMIGFVSPRSDNATICNSPYLDVYRAEGPDASYANHKLIERHLPRVTYVPTAVGFCLLIRNLMLREFGGFDEIYGRGYNEENDFIRRANQCGYRAVLANHAYAHHIGTVSFDQSDNAPKSDDERNHPLLLARWPEYDRIVGRYFESSDYRAQRLTAGLIPEDGRLRILFDCRVLLCHHNGTQEHLRQLLTAFARDHGARFAAHVLCGTDAFAYHGLDRVAGLTWCDETEMQRRAFAVAMKLGQPFNGPDLFYPTRWAALTGFLMLDTIAMDCQQLDDHDLDTLWRQMYDMADLVGYNSAFTRDQFRRRFDVPESVIEFVSPCSTDIADYQAEGAPDDAHEGAHEGAGGGILLVGNHFPHKHVRPMLDAIRRDGPTRVSVLGVEAEGEHVTGYRAGNLPQALVDRLYDEAELLLFPSHYEGFGLPVLHALARRTPVVARDLPPLREVRGQIAGGANLHLAGTTEALAALALSRPAWIDGVAAEEPSRNWADAAAALAEAFERAIAGFDFRTCRRHKQRADMLRARLDAEHHMREARRRADDFEREASETHQRAERAERRAEEAEARAAEATANVEALTAKATEREQQGLFGRLLRR